MADELKSIAWTGESIRLIDQTLLPGELTYLEIDDVDGLVEAIQRLVVRGAPALGAAGALGVVVAMRQGGRQGWTSERLAEEIQRIRRARPTAFNLSWAVDQVVPFMDQGDEVVLRCALKLMSDDEAANHAIGARGAEWILNHAHRRPLRVLTHCNAGALATTAWGSALGIVRELHCRGLVEMVYVDETRPLMQGSRLTAWELGRAGIPHLVEVDSAAASTILGGQVDVAIIGADRIAANGDTANKIGSLGVALACHYARIPFVVAAPESTIDHQTATGDEITVERRSEDEVLAWGGVALAPRDTHAHNPAFDVTPARFVSAVVTEERVLEISRGQLPIETSSPLRATPAR